MWRYAIPVVVLAAVGAFLYKGLYLRPDYIPSPLIGKQVPEFSLPELEDASVQVTANDLKGQLSLFNVWATWCVGCRQEHAYLVELSRTTDIPIYGLNWQDDRDAAIRWLQTLGDPYVASGFDEAGSVAIDWGVYGAPETFLVDADGTILYKHIAPLTPEVWHSRFMPIIEEKCASGHCGSGKVDE